MYQTIHNRTATFKLDRHVFKPEEIAISEQYYAFHAQLMSKDYAIVSDSASLEILSDYG